MKVRFAADALADPDSWWTLDRLIDHFFEGRHFWQIDDPDEVEQSPWLLSEPEGSRTTRRNLDALQRHVVQAQYQPESKAHTLFVTVCLVAAPPETLAPRDVLRLLETPVHVVVEDSASDGAFVHAMIRAFGREVLRAAFEERWWELVHGGGSSVSRRVQELVAREPRGPRRILVLSDSDRLKPDDPARPDDRAEKVRIMERCRDTHDVVIAVLRKREIENYLPIGALQRVPRSKQAVYRAFLALEQRQRDFFDMKSGFQLDAQGGVVIPMDQQELFRHLPPRIGRGLVGGFGKEVWEYFDKAADVVTREAVYLTCPDDPGEIERVLDAIESLL